ncbi:hypothetical protein [Agromyces cerinus]|uniref:Uncharacterized protein n=1 Tax=Agromyces cerinus subsp. cerinus TaxID=232089 RepID=A0A1N6F9P7_9MICO|nr:hypothetical protein [Agromyces cerinus]SIN91962.1 hypothetical protein SAMN05443544_1867 [Agromyces cerinus subsp. cerinus]
MATTNSNENIRCPIDPSHRLLRGESYAMVGWVCTECGVQVASKERTELQE